jgi:hypothetical protein
MKKRDLQLTQRPACNGCDIRSRRVDWLTPPYFHSRVTTRRSVFASKSGRVVDDAIKIAFEAINDLRDCSMQARSPPRIAVDSSTFVSSRADACVRRTYGYMFLRQLRSYQNNSDPGDFFMQDASDDRSATTGVETARDRRHPLARSAAPRALIAPL